MNRQARILIVDDERTLREILSIALAKRGYECETATNGEEALAVASKRAFDLIITDLKMPRLGGIELIKRLRKEQPELPVIIMTGYADLESARKALHLHVSDYLVKPFEGLSEVQNAVRRALETRPNRAATRTLLQEFERRTREFDLRERHLTQRLERTQVEMRDLAKRLERSEAVGSGQVGHIDELIGDAENGILITDAGGMVLSLNGELRRQLEIPNFHGSGFAVDRIPGDSALRGAIVESRLRRQMGTDEPVTAKTTDGSGETSVYRVYSTRLANRRDATVGMMTTVRAISLAHRTEVVSSRDSTGTQSSSKGGRIPAVIGG